MAIKEKKNDFGLIGVLMGGASSERGISLKSGHAVYNAIKSSRLDTIAIDIKTENVRENISLIKSKKIDCAFIALHGRFGEDGQIQAILETLKIAYSGSGVKASRLAMDKIASLRIFERSGLNIPAYQVVRKNTNLKIREELGLPFVVKPATHGSSIGLSIIDKKGDLEKAVNFANLFDKRVIIQEYIKGRELTAGILDEEALPIIEIIPKKSFFDYEAKYKEGMADYIIPAKLPKRCAGMIQKAALSAHKLLGCSGCSRVDIILSEDNTPYILEINTIPGFTSTSLLPKAAKAAGIDFNALCLKLIRLAYEKK